MRLDLLPADRFPAGSGPFGVRGMVVSGVVGYAEQTIDGGAAAVRAQLDPDVSGYLERSIFLASGLYDLSPVGAFCRAAAKLEGRTAAEFIRARSRRSAEETIRGVYRTQLKAKTTRDMAARLPRIFQRFFDPCRAEGAATSDTSMRVEFRALPEPLGGFYAWSTEGYVGASLEHAGARDVKMSWETPVAAGETDGIRLVNLALNASWAGS